MSKQDTELETTSGSDGTVAIADPFSGTPPAVDRPSGRRRSRLVVVLAAVVAVMLGSGLLTSCESNVAERNAVVDAVNQSRAQHGIPALRSNWVLDVKADNWAQVIRDRCALSHSVLRDGAPSNWKKLGENVGRGGSVTAIHVAYMNSPSHRANILDRSFNEMGAAAVWGNCRNSNGAMVRTLFTVHVFMKS